MSIFDKFKKSKEDLPVQAGEAISKPEIAKVDIAKKVIKKEVKASETKVDVKKESGRPSSVNISKLHSILIRPLITEKATNLGQKNQYVFEISNKANKIQVAQAIEARYGVKPTKVNVLNISGKIVRHGRNTGKTKDWKKAIVILPEGKNIQIHEGA